MLVPVPLLVFSAVLMRRGNDMVLTGPEPALGPDREAGDPLPRCEGPGSIRGAAPVRRRPEGALPYGYTTSGASSGSTPSCSVRERRARGMADQATARVQISRIPARPSPPADGPQNSRNDWGNSRNRSWPADLAKRSRRKRAPRQFVVGVEHGRCAVGQFVARLPCAVLGCARIAQCPVSP